MLALAALTFAWSPASAAHGGDCQQEPTEEVGFSSVQADVYASPENDCGGVMAHHDRLDCQRSSGFGSSGSHAHVTDGRGCWTGVVADPTVR